MTAFRKRTWWKGAIGLALAYALALQTLLLAFTSTQMAAAAGFDPAAICLSAHSDSTSDDAKLVTHANCAVCSLFAATPLVPPVATSLAPGRPARQDPARARA